MSSPSKVEPSGLDRKALEHEKSRLEGLLALDEAWRALKQLEERLARGEATSAVGADALKASLERELASNRLYSVYRDVVAKLAAPAVAAASPVVAAKAAVDAADATAFRTKVTVKPSGAGAGAGERAGTETGDDDLTRIRGLTRPVAERLTSLGISRFETIANWTRADVDRISLALGLGRAIVRQSWVDQAAILVQTRPVRDPAPAVAPAAPTAAPAAPQGVTPPAAKPAVAAPARPPLPQPPAPPPQAVLGTLVNRRPDQPVNEPLLSLQRPRAGVSVASATAAKPVPAPAGAAAASKPPAPSAGAARPEAARPVDPIRAAALAAAANAPAIPPAAKVAAPAATTKAAAAPAATTPSTPPAAKVAAPAKPVVRPAVPPPAAPIKATNPYESRLDLIDGLGPDAIAALVKAGVTCAAQIAAFKAEDVRLWRRDLGESLRAPFAHVIEQAAMLASGQLPAAARRTLERPAASIVPRPAPLTWGEPQLLARLQREAEDAAKPKTREEADRIARRSLREALAGGDPERAAFAATMTTARTRLVDRLALIDLPRKPRGSSDDLVTAFEERMAALQRDLDEMERRLRADPVPRVAEAAATDTAAKPVASPTETVTAAAVVGADIAAALGSGSAGARTASPGDEVTPEPGTRAVAPPSAPETTPVAKQPAVSRDVVAAAKPAAAVTDVGMPPAGSAASTATRVTEPSPAPTHLPPPAAKPGSGLPSQPASAARASEAASKPVAPAPTAVAAPVPRSPDVETRDVEPDPLMGLGEADVVIVAKAAPPRPAEAAAAGSASPPVVSAESLAKRLRRFGTAEPIEADGYAAYHDEVEEAAVEIVRGPRPPVPAKAPATGTASAKSAAGGERNSAIKRFVRALSGGA